MEVETKYGWFIVSETTTGLMAEKFGTSSQFFINDRWMPNEDCTMDVSLMIQAIETEYEFVHNIKR